MVKKPESPGTTPEIVDKDEKKVASFLRQLCKDRRAAGETITLHNMAVRVAAKFPEWCQASIFGDNTIKFKVYRLVRRNKIEFGKPGFKPNFGKAIQTKKVKKAAPVAA